MPSDEKVEKVELPVLPEPAVCYADHSYPAYSAAQMQDYARAALAAAEAGEQPVAWRYRIPVYERSDWEPWRLTADENLARGYAHTDGQVEPLFVSPPSEASREERAAIRKEAFEEAAKIADSWNEQHQSSSFAHDAVRDIATAIRARGETERQCDPILPLRPGESLLMQERHGGGDYAVQVDTTTERLVQKVETPGRTTVFEMGILSEEKS